MEMEVNWITVKERLDVMIAGDLGIWRCKLIALDGHGGQLDNGYGTVRCRDSGRSGDVVEMWWDLLWSLDMKCITVRVRLDVMIAGDLVMWWKCGGIFYGP